MPNCAQSQGGTLTTMKVNETRAERNARIRLAAQMGLSIKSIARRERLSESYVARLASGYQHDAASYRVYRLPSMLKAARHKVRALENEARRYGMLDLLEGGQ